MKKIYFAGSIRGGRGDIDLYAQIIGLLRGYGQILTEHLANPKISSYGETHMSNAEIYERDISRMNEADIVIAEVTTPSLGVGYELGYAEAQNKKIVVLYRPQERKRLSAMLAGNQNMTIVEYTDMSELPAIFDTLLK